MGSGFTLSILVNYIYYLLARDIFNFLILLLGIMTNVDTNNFKKVLFF